ncbi:hypothetical protein ACWDSJ_02470 [Nocardia sp. NPDC003482]
MIILAMQDTRGDPRHEGSTMNPFFVWLQNLLYRIDLGSANFTQG